MFNHNDNFNGIIYRIMNVRENIKEEERMFQII